jgi:transcription elongation factor GreA
LVVRSSQQAGVDAPRLPFVVLKGPSPLDKVPMTAAGFERLQDELKHLKSVERPAVIRAIAEAREHGDLSENAEYHAARERQSFIEGRVAELEDTIARAEVIDVSKLSGKNVKFGATVKVADEESGEETSYQIVGAAEADIATGRLSVTAPLARALIGKTVGDSVEVTTPRGSRVYEVVDVRFG